jgi:hypothetical protein
MSQNEKVLSHLKTGRNITAVSAQALYGVFRLAARICELKSAGNVIKSIPCRDINGKQYAMYRLSGEAKVATNPGVEGLY